MSGMDHASVAPMAQAGHDAMWWVAIVGLPLMAWLLWKAWRYTFSAEYYSPVEMSGLYWHFVDLVWMFVFPLIYIMSVDMHGALGH